MSPAVRKLAADNKLDPALIPATGRNGRLTKADVLAYLERPAEATVAKWLKAVGDTVEADDPVVDFNDPWI